MMASNHYYFAMFGVLFIFSIFFLVSGETNDMYESLFRSPLKRVFVYGTLKRGQPNHELLSSSSNGYAKFIGIGKTLHKYPLVIASKYNIPFLLKHPGVGHQILGELYDVDSKMMDKLDELEEHPSFYVRTEEDIIMARDKKDVNIEQIGCVTKAWTYFLPKFKSNLLQLPMYSSYASEGVHGLKYGERYLRDKNYDHRAEVQ